VLDGDADGVSLPALLDELGKRELQGLLLEGGPTLAWAAVRDDLVDELALYVAPSLVGGAAAPSWLGGEGFAPVGEARRVELRAVTRLGEDLRVEARVHRDR
jgi:diaminohydroxyphosphoribosylaminopyrimidine deaminase/5-amino-6-(5-phosphoribosylamino)uracil reductase